MDRHSRAAVYRTSNRCRRQLSPVMPWHGHRGAGLGCCHLRGARAFCMDLTIDYVVPTTGPGATASSGGPGYRAHGGVPRMGGGPQAGPATGSGDDPVQFWPCSFLADRQPGRDCAGICGPPMPRRAALPGPGVPCGHYSGGERCWPGPGRLGRARTRISVMRPGRAGRPGGVPRE